MVHLENICKSYGDDKIVDNVNFTVEKGEILAMVGPSGCGKTTTLKMMNRLIPYTSGRIFIKGDDISTVDPVKLRREIGYVIQQVGLLPHLTIQDNIAFVLQLLQIPKAKQQERAIELIQTVGLPAEFLKKHPRQLSGGQQQRVGVARALAADPDLILMDEPFGAVDPIARDQLQLELLKLQERLHKTIVFVTHDMQEAFRLGTRILVMRKGKVVKVGKPLELIQEQDTFIQDFIGRKAIFDVLDTISVMDVLDRQVAIVNIETNQINNSQKSRCEYYLAINKIGEFLGVIEESCLPVDGNFKPEDIVAFDSYIDNKASVRNAIEKMLWSGHCYLPVLNDNILVGVVTFDKCARLMQK